MRPSQLNEKSSPSMITSYRRVDRGVLVHRKRPTSGSGLAPDNPIVLDRTFCQVSGLLLFETDSTRVIFGFLPHMGSDSLVGIYRYAIGIIQIEFH